jgi:uncharacterized SAM-binding protein YcdF (DUF218 family)
VCLNALVRSDSRRLHDWLSLADTPSNADLIFVLAGGMDRKSYGLELFRQGLAPRILFSVGRFEIRRFSKMPLPVPLDLLKFAQDWPPAQRHFFVVFEGDKAQVNHVCPRRFGTLNEISVLEQWLRDHPEIQSLLIVSNSTHLRRVRMCCRTLLVPQKKLSFVASREGAPLETGVARSASLAHDLFELLKVLVYGCALKLARSLRDPVTLHDSRNRSTSGSNSTDKSPH